MPEQRNKSGLDPVGEVIAEDRSARKVPTMAERLIDQRKQDQAEAAELQSWLAGNARTVRPVDGSGLFAWAHAALRRQGEQLLAPGASEEVEAHLERQIDILRIDLNAALAREAALREELKLSDDLLQAQNASYLALRKSLTAAEQRNAELEGLHKSAIKIAGDHAVRVSEIEGLLIEVAQTLRTGGGYGWEDMLADTIDAVIEPTESGASE